MKKNLALAAIALVFLLGAAFQSPISVPGQLKDIQAQLSNIEAQNASLAAQVASLANKGPRKFYLTKTNHQGDTALTACAAGDHMATQWEIHDPSNFRYDTELGLTRDDSGSGPPVLRTGWIRTGEGNGSSSNCNGWSTSSGSSRGLIAALSQALSPTHAITIISPWFPVGEAIGSDGTTPCSDIRGVWCVQD